MNVLELASLVNEKLCDGLAPVTYHGSHVSIGYNTKGFPYYYIQVYADGKIRNCAVNIEYNNYHKGLDFDPMIMNEEEIIDAFIEKEIKLIKMVRKDGILSNHKIRG